MGKSEGDDQHEYWDRVAESKNFTHPPDLNLLARFVAKNARVVDFGCGYGRVLKILREAGYMHLRGYDSSAGLIRRGEREGSPSLSVLAHGVPLPEDNSSLDCVLLFAVLTCIPSNQGQQTLVDMLHEKLKPGGILYISDYYLQKDSQEVKRYHMLNNDPENDGLFTLAEGASFRHHSRDWIRKLLAKFQIRAEQEIKVHTMNGHSAEAFQLILQK